MAIPEPGSSPPLISALQKLRAQWLDLSVRGNQAWTFRPGSRRKSTPGTLELDVSALQPAESEALVAALGAEQKGTLLTLRAPADRPDRYIRNLFEQLKKQELQEWQNHLQRTQPHEPRIPSGIAEMLDTPVRVEPVVPPAAPGTQFPELGSVPRRMGGISNPQLAAAQSAELARKRIAPATVLPMGEAGISLEGPATGTVARPVYGDAMTPEEKAILDKALIDEELRKSEGVLERRLEQEKRAREIEYKVEHELDLPGNFSRKLRKTKTEWIDLLDSLNLRWEREGEHTLSTRFRLSPEDHAQLEQALNKLFGGGACSVLAGGGNDGMVCIKVNNRSPRYVHMMMEHVSAEQNARATQKAIDELIASQQRVEQEAMRVSHETWLHERPAVLPESVYSELGKAKPPGLDLIDSLNLTWSGEGEHAVSSEFALSHADHGRGALKNLLSGLFGPDGYELLDGAAAGMARIKVHERPGYVRAVMDQVSEEQSARAMQKAADAFAERELLADKESTRLAEEAFDKEMWESREVWLREQEALETAAKTAAATAAAREAALLQRLADLHEQPQLISALEKLEAQGIDLSTRTEAGGRRGWDFRPGSGRKDIAGTLELDVAGLEAGESGALARALGAELNGSLLVLPTAAAEPDAHIGQVFKRLQERLDAGDLMTPEEKRILNESLIRDELEKSEGVLEKRRANEAKTLEIRERVAREQEALELAAEKAAREAAVREHMRAALPLGRSPVRDTARISCVSDIMVEVVQHHPGINETEFGRQALEQVAKRLYREDLNYLQDLRRGVYHGNAGPTVTGWLAAEITEETARLADPMRQLTETVKRYGDGPRINVEGGIAAEDVEAVAAAARDASVAAHRSPPAVISPHIPSSGGGGFSGGGGGWGSLFEGSSATGSRVGAALEETTEKAGKGFFSTRLGKAAAVGVPLAAVGGWLLSGGASNGAGTVAKATASTADAGAPTTSVTNPIVQGAVTAAELS